MTEVTVTAKDVSAEAALEHPPIYSTAPLGATHLHEKLATLPPLATTPDMSSLGPNPAHIICPACNESITTHLKYKVGDKAQYVPPSSAAPLWFAIAAPWWNIAYGRSRMAIGCLIAGIFGAMIPLCMNSLKDVEHFCPTCGFMIARFNRTKDNSHTVVSLVPTNKPSPDK